jgi:hypothetical protein
VNGEFPAARDCAGADDERCCSPCPAGDPAVEAERDREQDRDPGAGDCGGDIDFALEEDRRLACDDVAPKVAVMTPISSAGTGLIPKLSALSAPKAQ